LELNFSSIAEPLLAPVESCGWDVLLSSEEPRFGGVGTPWVAAEDGWHISGHAAFVLGPKALSEKKERDADGESDPSNRSDASAG
jgi:maltooligosyltrehalose trehalohydrolase